MVDDFALRRLLQGEAHRMNQNLADQALLGTLRTYDTPTTRTKGGAPYAFDRAALDQLWDELTPLARAILRVPIRFHIPHDHPGECFLADSDAFDAVTQLGLRPGAPRDGKVWVSLPRVLDWARGYPTLVQFVRR